VSQEVDEEVGDTNDPVGVEVAATTAGKEANLLVMDVLGVSRTPGEEEGHNGAAACTHSEVTVDGETPVNISTNDTANFSTRLVTFIRQI
jgi:hypothetical protein